jgi:hypothetical protein
MTRRSIPILFLCLTAAVAVPALAEVETQPLYRYKSDESNWIFTTSAKLPAGLGGSWKREAVVAHVPRQPSESTRPIYSLVKSDSLGVRYAYTSSATESAAGWQRQEAVAFYVSTQKLPGTAPLYRLYAPLRTLGDPNGFSAPAPGSDTHYYTPDPSEKKRALAAGWLSQGVLGYVWLTPQELPEPKKIRITGDVKPAPLRPSIRVAGAKLQTDGRTLYTIEVTNLERFPAEWFVSAGPALPPNPCGDGRMIATVFVLRNGTRAKGACESLSSRGALASVNLRQTLPLENDDRVQLSVYDRLLRQEMVSEPYSAGWIAVGPLLQSAGCKSFLGRDSSFLCSDATAFTACENLRKSGKPITCTQAGKKN